MTVCRDFLHAEHPYAGMFSPKHIYVRSFGLNLPQILFLRYAQTWYEHVEAGFAVMATPMPGSLDLGLASNLGTAKMPAVRIAVAADALKMFDARRSVGIANKAVIGFMLASWNRMYGFTYSIWERIYWFRKYFFWRR